MPPKKKVVIEGHTKHGSLIQTGSSSLKDLSIQILEPETAMLLFYSKEQSVLLKTLHGLDKFIAARPENAITLNQLNIVKEMLKTNLFTYPELFIKRFVLKITASIYGADKRIDFEEAEEVFKISLSLYFSTDDPFLIEFSGLVILNLMKEPKILSILEDSEEFFLKTYAFLEKTTDPDILHNCYRILITLYRNGLNQLKICSYTNFPYSRAIGDITSQFDEIQVAALEVIREIVRCRNPVYLRKITCDDFYDAQMQLIEKPGSRNNELTLTLMQESLHVESAARMFTTKGFLTRLLQFYEWDNSPKTKIAEVLAILTQYPYFLEMLHYASVTDIFISLLDEITNITPNILYGLKNMLDFVRAFNYISERNINKQVLAIVKDIATTDVVRQAAADLVYVLSSRDVLVCENLKVDLPPIIIHLLQKPFGDVPLETIVTLLSTLNNLANHPLIRSEVINNSILCETLVSSIRTHFRSSIVIASLINCAVSFICETPLQNALLQDNVGALILRTLKDTAIIVKNASADFILISTKFPDFAQKYIERGVLEFMLKDSKSLASCPSWTLAIDAILATNTSLKFCIRQYLDITDVIRKPFNISKKHYQDFSVFLKILKENVSPLYSLISVSFENLEGEEDSVIHVPIEQPVVSTQNPAGGDSFISSNTTDSLQEWVYCRNPPDDNLPKYLKKLRELLQIRGLMPSKNVYDMNSNLIDITKITERVKIVGELVYGEMCGTVQGTQSVICSDQVVLNHLNYLKCHLHCNIIPLGRIRFGAEFERAILFKALADQIGLPCTLRRAIDGRILYNEVPIPVEDKKKSSVNLLPMRLLRPTHIVDLMDHPGAIYRLESRQAYQYLHLI